ncbi:Dihydrodipicolinate synthase/N-acetylneuraminate lyase [Lentzea waywayandensis]|uniref:Dihydrodipicolinate synthase/N-acetylneuraminate lyase n=1 Tax=Lentzea waywayandensis TaxID=84724 RepID=A0A1I6F783_9PSEU|nr:dihydrodipicolinate synthase family protein [Lentzea waywayandensis]SFR25814.1 Dihydrodipicolinate synthase/N-acetylneuraminate lyase [Lentzea waywayandensis]
MDFATAALLHRGTVIPAHPLALDESRTLDEERQRALTRYYLEAGAGGLAVGVHTTQFEIREHGLYRPVLELAAEEIAGRARLASAGTGAAAPCSPTAAAPVPPTADPSDAAPGPFLRIAGVAGPTSQAVAEAEIARGLGYDAVLVSPGGLADLTPGDLLDRSAAIGEVLPTIGFYLQEAVGGRYLPRAYWLRLADQPSTVAVKAAPFDRYRTLELVQGVADSDRGADVALYTGNDDNIVSDLLTPFHVRGGVRRFVGGLLGHWAVWTRSAVRILQDAHAAVDGDVEARARVEALSAMCVDANAAVFDVRNGFAGVIAGVHEVLRRQGVLRGIWCLDPDETLSPGQADELTRVQNTYADWLN